MKYRKHLAASLFFAAHALAAIANTNRVIITESNQKELGTTLTVAQREHGSNTMFTIAFPPDDPKIEHVSNCSLILSTATNPAVKELWAPLQLGRNINGTTSAEFFIANSMIPRAFVSVEYRTSDQHPFSSATRSFYLKLDSYRKTANNQIQATGVPPAPDL
jgi:hypothetical protein